MRISPAALPLLFLAIAAHGERDPTDVIAVVLGQEITVADVAESSIDQLINGRLVRKFKEDNGIAATGEDIAAFAERALERGRQALLDLEADRAELVEALETAAAPQQRQGIQERLDRVERRIKTRSRSPQAEPDAWATIAKPWVERWKRDKALFDKYGGRAHWQQVGVQPFDAMIKFLEEQEASGAFTILDEEYEDEFWAYWRSEGHRFIPEEEAVELMAKPWWLMDRPSDE
ncbi:MAG: hypothetical protein F4X36_21500 [Gammaproteobacteria bacterium]|nr:hypothetical protein [Gammaproteobacteria bacterium]